MSQFLFLKQQEQRIKKRIAQVERVIRSGRIDASFKAALVLPAQKLALSRLRTGLYGLCVDCGKQIPHERLQVLPGAIRCLSCQERIES